jgi:ssDNA-binding Zn-finger/Zn-ribbon topoisomerase 1
MICEKCGTPMIIDEWEGWIWFCGNCEAEGEYANTEEIKQQESEVLLILESLKRLSQ